MMSMELTADIHVRLTVEDKEALERLSKASGMNSSQYLRWVVRNNARGLGKVS